MGHESSISITPPLCIIIPFLSGRNISGGIPLKTKRTLMSIAFSHHHLRSMLAGQISGLCLWWSNDKFNATNHYDNEVWAIANNSMGQATLGPGTKTNTVLNISSNNPEPYPSFYVIQLIFGSLQVQIPHTHNESLTDFSPLCAHNYFIGLQPSSFDP